MKLFYFFVIYALIQLWPIVAANPVTTNSSLTNLFKYYDHEMDIIAEDFCEQFKNVSEKLLEDKDIKEASVKELKEFKELLQEFLRDYEHFKRYKIYQPLMEIVLNLATLDDDNKSEEENSKSNEKFPLIMKKYFANSLKEYEQNYTKMVEEKLKPKIEEFKKHSKEGDFKKLLDLKNRFNNLKSCQYYECLPTAQEQLFREVQGSKQLITTYAHLLVDRQMLLLYIHDYNKGKQILKDAKFSELSLEFQHKITNDINKFIRNFENHHDFTKFFDFALQKLNYSSKYNEEYFTDLGFSSKDAKLLMEIIQKYNTFDSTKYEKSIRDVINLTNRKMAFLTFLDPEATRF